MKPTVKITNFERSYFKHKTHRPTRNNPASSINFIIYTPNKKLQFAEKLIKEKQKQREDVTYNKCNKIQAFTYALSNCTPQIPTYCIIDQQISQQIMVEFMRNQFIVKNKDFYTLALFLDQMNDIPKDYLRIRGLDLITTKQEKVIEFIENIFMTCKLRSQMSTSSLNSNDFRNIHEKFQGNNQVNQISSPQREDYQEEKLILQSSPGYKYNKAAKTGNQDKGNIFGRAGQRIDPLQWNKSRQTFAKFQKN